MQMCFFKQQTTWKFLKVKFCDFEKYFILKNVLNEPFSKFLDLGQIFLSLDNSMNTDQSI